MRLSLQQTEDKAGKSGGGRRVQLLHPVARLLSASRTLSRGQQPLFVWTNYSLGSFSGNASEKPPYFCMKPPLLFTLGPLPAHLAFTSRAPVWSLVHGWALGSLWSHTP